jgi:hypothetical protein
MYFYRYDYVFSLNVYVWLPWLRFFRAFSSVARQMSGYNPQRRGTASTLPNFCCSMYFLCCSMYCFFFVTYSVLFVCICVLNYCHRVATQLQLNISYITYIKCQCIKSFLTLALDGVGGELHAPTALSILKILRNPGSPSLLGHCISRKWLKAGVNGQTASACTYFHQWVSQCSTDGVNRQTV